MQFAFFCNYLPVICGGVCEILLSVIFMYVTGPHNNRTFGLTTLPTKDQTAALIFIAHRRRIIV